MDILQARLNTFKKSKRVKNPSKPSSSTTLKWPHPARFRANAETLAEAGFYYDPSYEDPDNVICFACEKELGGWEEDDDPFLIHYTKCGQTCCWASARCGMFSDLDDHGRFVSTDKTRFPTHKQMEKARYDTFLFGKGWIHDKTPNHGANSKTMAQAGFTYTPQHAGDDLATCFYCDTSLSGWDAEDDPLEEHHKREAKSGITCSFIAGLSSDRGLNSKPASKAQTSKAVSKPPSKSTSKSKHQDAMKSTKTYDGTLEDESEDNGTSEKPVYSKTPHKARTTSSSTRKSSAKTPKPPSRSSSRSNLKNVVEEDDEPPPLQPSSIKKSRSQSRSIAKSDAVNRPELDDDEVKPAPRKPSKSQMKKVASEPEEELERKSSRSKAKPPSVVHSLDVDDEEPVRQPSRSKVKQPPVTQSMDANDDEPIRKPLRSKSKPSSVAQSVDEERVQKVSRSKAKPSSIAPSTNEEEFVRKSSRSKTKVKVQESEQEEPITVKPSKHKRTASKAKAKVPAVQASEAESEVEVEAPVVIEKPKKSKQTLLVPESDVDAEATIVVKKSSRKIKQQQPLEPESEVEPDTPPVIKKSSKKAKQPLGSESDSTIPSTTGKKSTIKKSKTKKQTLETDSEREPTTSVISKTSSKNNKQHQAPAPQDLFNDDVFTDHYVHESPPHLATMKPSPSIEMPPLFVPKRNTSKKDASALENREAPPALRGKDKKKHDRPPMVSPPLASHTSEEEPIDAAPRLPSDAPMPLARLPSNTSSKPPSKDLAVQNPKPPFKKSEKFGMEKQKMKVVEISSDEEVMEEPVRHEQRSSSNPLVQGKENNRSSSKVQPVLHHAPTPPIQSSQSSQNELRSKPPSSSQTQGTRSKKISVVETIKPPSTSHQPAPSPVSPVINPDVSMEYVEPGPDQESEEDDSGKMIVTPVTPPRPTTPQVQLPPLKPIEPIPEPIPSEETDVSEPPFIPPLSRLPFIPLTSLSEAELDMTVEEWIRYQMEVEYDKFRRDGERELQRFRQRAEEVRKTIEGL